MDDQLKEDIRFINKYLYAVQKHRIQLSNWIFAKESDGKSPSKRTYKLFKELEDHERRAKRLALEIVSQDPLWTEFFINIRGVAESLATSLMAEIGDISRFKTPSSLWAYGALTAQYVEAKCSNGHKMIMSSDKHETCPILKGFNEQTQEEGEEEANKCGGKITITEKITGKAPKRKTGYHYLFNTKFKTICWKISAQLVKQGDDFFRELYRSNKNAYTMKAVNAGLKILPAEEIRTKKDKDKYISIGHIENRARRKLVKHFLVYLWEAWRGIEGLDIRTPYAIEQLGHTGYISWIELKGILQREKEIKKSA